MELDKRQWYVRWFFWSLTVLDEFADQHDSRWRYNDGTNLCHFMRVTLLWCPLVLLLNVTVYALGIGVLTALPIYFWGGTGYSYFVGAIAIVVGIIVGLKALFRQLSVWRQRYQKIRPLKPLSEMNANNSQPVKPAPTGPSFWEVVWQYIVAAKQKVCPIITFKRHVQGVAR